MLIINHMSTSANFTKINLYCQAEETKPGIGVQVSFATKKPKVEILDTVPSTDTEHIAELIPLELLRVIKFAKNSLKKEIETHINNNLTTILLYTHTCSNIRMYVLESDNLDSDLTQGSEIEKLVKNWFNDIWAITTISWKVYRSDIHGVSSCCIKNRVLLPKENIEHVYHGAYILTNCGRCRIDNVDE